MKIANYEKNGQKDIEIKTTNKTKNIKMTYSWFNQLAVFYHKNENESRNLILMLQE